jgi:hypothetical protein
MSCAATGAPSRGRRSCSGNIYLASNRSEVGERLVLPLADDSGAMMHAIGASVYRMELKLGEGPITRESMTETFTPLAASVGGRKGPSSESSPPLAGGD